LNGFDVEELVAGNYLLIQKKFAKSAMTAFVKYVPNKPGHFHIHRSKTWIEYMSKFYTIDFMDPVPMFVGEDGIQSHAVGAD
jgi:hypothetical protein